MTYKLLNQIEFEAPQIKGISTGTKIDELFYTIVYKNEKIIKQSLGGLPNLSIINIVGVPDTGKSLFAEQFAIYQALKDNKVLYVTVESPAIFLYNSMKIKAEYLNIPFNEVSKNIVVIDASSNTELREESKLLIDTMSAAIKENNTSITIIDSITGLYEHKEIMARQIVRIFFNFLKKFNQTGIFISQKRSSQQETSAEAAGGLAVAHIVDGTIVMDKKLIETRWDSQLYNMPIGSVLRTLRIDGCRLTGHDSRTWVYEITEGGTIKILYPLEEIINKKYNTYGSNE